MPSPAVYEGPVPADSSAARRFTAEQISCDEQLEVLHEHWNAEVRWKSGLVAGRAESSHNGPGHSRDASSTRIVVSALSRTDLMCVEALLLEKAQAAYLLVGMRGGQKIEGEYRTTRRHAWRTIPWPRSIRQALQGLGPRRGRRAASGAAKPGRQTGEDGREGAALE